MVRIKKILASLAFSFSSVLMVATPAGAAPGYSLLGEASEILDGSNGVVQLVSDDDPGFAGVDFDITEGMTFTDLTTLSAMYNVTDDNCGGGSPRFQVAVDTDGDGTSDGNVFIAIGPSPNFTECALGWQTTGNVIGNEDIGRYDFGQLGGSVFTTYSGAPADVLAGTVLSVQLVADGSWNANATGGDGEQTVWVDDVAINDILVSFEPVVTDPVMPLTKDECKKDGWQAFGVFKNQGDCVSFVATNGANTPANNPTF
jgi:hypothetical protein